MTPSRAAGDCVSAEIVSCLGKRYQDWPVADPAGQPLEVVRRIRYELYHHVWDLLESLVPAGNLIDIHRPIGGPT